MQENNSGVEEIIKYNNEHCHSPEPEVIDDLKLRARLKRRAKNSMDGPAQVIQAAIQDIPSGSAPYLPSINAMRMVVNRARMIGVPTSPKKLHNLVIPNKYSNFLLAHYSTEEDCILLFGTSENIRLLQLSPFWILDGTFRTCPTVFYQIYTVHGLIGLHDTVQKVVPLVFGLLSNKNKRIYCLFFELLKSRASQFGTNLQPDVVITDFEKASINAVKQVFPETKHKCCYFHLAQNIWKHIQSTGLSKQYSESTSFAHKMRHLAALAFLKPDEIPEAFEILKEKVLPKDARKVIDWFSKYYVNGTYKKRTTQNLGSLKTNLHKVPPLFPPDIWSVNSSIGTTVPITQNEVESWHHRWNTLLGRKKWNLCKTIEELNKEQKHTELIVEKLNSQSQETKRSKKKENREEKIKKHLEKKETMDLTTFLDGLAYLCYFKR